MGGLSPTHWLIVLVVVLLLLGTRKLPELARGLGQSMRILKAEGRALREDGTEEEGSSEGEPAQRRAGGGAEAAATPRQVGSGDSGPEHRPAADTRPAGSDPTSSGGSSRA